MTRRPFLAAAAILVLLTAALTWPQGRYLGTRVAEHQDPYLSIWRMAWIAHALTTDPGHLFDANIYFPERRTLAYSDATLLEGLVAAPLFWAHVSPVLIYNLMLLAGFVTSGLAMFVLARRLIGNDRGALVAAVVFAFVPYRFDHFMHLELQWAAWIPLTLWALHRTIDEGSWRFGALTGVFLWLQVLSCIYYGVFLALATAVLALLLLAVNPRKAVAAAPGLALGATIAIALTLVYMQPYLANVRNVGSRDVAQVLMYSARPSSYLVAPLRSWIWGWTFARLSGGAETQLFPGLIASALALVALVTRFRGHVWMYAVVGLGAIELSLGFNGRLYPWLYEHVWFFHGLRGAARFSIVAYCALAVLAGTGFAYLEARVAGPRVTRQRLLAGALALIAVDYASMPVRVIPRDIPAQTPDVYAFLRTLEPGVVLEMPVPAPWTLPGSDADYEFWSITHWRPMVNGYSGYVSPTYMDTLKLMTSFPDKPSIDRLRQLRVRYIIVHETLIERDAYEDLMLRMVKHPDLAAGGTYKDWIGRSRVFELR